MSIAKRLGAAMGPKVTEMAPQLTTNFVHEALAKAITGVGPLLGAAAAADKLLRDHGGDADQAIHDLIENHVRYAGLQGFATNIGGLVTMAVTVPANITGLALVQCHLVAGIVHLRGYDLDDKRVRNAILVCLLGEENILALLKTKKLPATPMALATAPVHDPHLDTVVSSEVASELLTRVAGKRLASVVGRRTPVIGGLVGAGTDGYATWKIGRYTDREFLPRTRR